MKTKTGSVYRYGRTIPEFVKNLRIEYNLTQKQLADQMGVHGQYVSNIERGEYDCPLSFCGLLYAIMPSDRIPYLTDLVSEASTSRALHRMGGRNGKKSSRRKTKSKLRKVRKKTNAKS